MKLKNILTTVPVGVWWLYDKAEKYIRKKQAKDSANTIDNIEKLFLLKKSGAISEEEFSEMKAKLKERL